MARVKAMLGAAAMLALIPLPAAAQPSSPEERAAAMARPGIVYISVTWHGWVRDKRTGEVFGGTAGYEVKTSCSGAVISPDGHVATASHCVHTGPLGGGGALFEAAIADLGRTGRVRDPAKARTEFAEHGLAEGANPDSPVDRLIQVERMEARDGEQVRDIAPATVVDLVAPADGDVAVLKVPRDHLPSMEIRQDQTPVGTPILAIGYPGSTNATVDPSLEPSNKNGQISARRTQSGRPFYEFSAAATHGMSGGPVVDMQGGIVGLVSQGSPGETQSFNFAASSQTLVDILKGKGIAVGVGQHDKDYRTGLDRYFEGDYDGAVEYFDAVLAGSPGHQQATEYRRLATDKGGQAGSSPTTLLVVFAVLCGGIAIATATAGTAIALTRRKRLAGGGPSAVPEPLPVGAPGTVGNHGAIGGPGSAGGPGAGPLGGPGWAAGPGLGAGPGPLGTPPAGTPFTYPPMGTPPAGMPPMAAPLGTPSAVTETRSSPLGLPVVLGDDQQPDGQADPDQTERRKGALRDHQADDQTERSRGHVQPGAPLPGHPRPDQPDDGDGAHQGGEDQRA
ncbi:trypsin-like peptidase domain-containing protein [Actinosynnema sp. CS-041913]|uniref:trypsin-like peptidase domain-containing protein n=1 Tax=Actinosynnema sp. CS-041913 TaxID=3239917 RepID=UPI003D8E0044